MRLNRECECILILIFDINLTHSGLCYSHIVNQLPAYDKTASDRTSRALLVAWFEQLGFEDLRRQASAHVDQVLMRVVEQHALREVVRVGAHEDAAVVVVALSRDLRAVTHSFDRGLVHNVRPMIDCEWHLLLLVHVLVVEVPAERGEHSPRRAPERIKVLDLLQVKVDERERPVIPIAMNGHDEHVHGEDVHLLALGPP